MASTSILPAHSYGLGVAFEHMRVPPNITVICLGKSTYARLGIIVNTTPAEASWEGAPHPGVQQFLGCRLPHLRQRRNLPAALLRGDPCETTYRDRAGKYQHQPERVTLARV
jgi:dCTP deaminase